ncbi:hypothetical protein ACHAXN_012449 [Cyclotella atomus]
MLQQKILIQMFQTRQTTLQTQVRTLMLLHTQYSSLGLYKSYR